MDYMGTLLINAVGLAIVLLSMAFRMKGKYLVHEITMIAMIGFTIFGAVANTVTATSSSLNALVNPLLHLVVVAPHMILAIATLVFGVWLVALWRPHSTTFAAKSKRQAQLTTILWVVTFLVGVLVFVVLHTSLFA